MFNCSNFKLKLDLRFNELKLRLRVPWKPPESFGGLRKRSYSSRLTQ